MNSASTNTVIRGTYYPHIDGIRAFAVLSVLLYHVFPQCCTGGFIGVDVFFVLSGFLITGGLKRDLEQGEYSISRFYVRRIRRILPAYAAMVLFSVGLCALLYFGAAAVPALRAARASLYFGCNLFFAAHSGYFDADTHSNPMLNMWSLSVEEQFYVFFPILLALLFRYRRSLLQQGLACLWILSLILSTVFVFCGKADYAFYGLFLRAWELLSGSLLAWNIEELNAKAKNGTAAILSLTVLCAAFFLYHDTLPFPGATALLPVLCTAYLVLSGDTGLARPILEHPLTVSIGKISYSLYLFHWPVLVYARYFFASQAGSPLLGVGVVAVSIFMAVLSWAVIEMPVRRTRWQPRVYFLFAIVLLAGLAAVIEGALAIAKNQLRSFHGEDWWAGTPVPSAVYAPPAFPCNEGMPVPFWQLGKAQDIRYVLWGDSHAKAMAPGFNTFSEQSGINGLYITDRDILLYKSHVSTKPRNGTMVDAVLQWLREHKELNHIVLVSRWAMVAEGPWPEQPRTPESYHVEGETSGMSADAIYELGFINLLRELHAMGKKVLVLSSSPEQQESVAAMRHKAEQQGKDYMSFATDYKSFTERQQNVNRVLRRIEQEQLAEVLWLDDYYFPNGEKRSLILPGGRYMYLDDDHLSPSGAADTVLHHKEAITDFLNR